MEKSFRTLNNRDLATVAAVTASALIAGPIVAGCAGAGTVVGLVIHRNLVDSDPYGEPNRS